mmetsp:Transcript_974/g.964  ORF Transcript_974/g.964 Transcript_974/m.964 type:complete len:80 (+) Transcript_974:362-601(+)
MLGKIQNSIPKINNKPNTMYRITVTPRIKHKSITDKYHKPNFAQIGQIGKQQAKITPITKNISRGACHHFFLATFSLHK